MANENAAGEPAAASGPAWEARKLLRAARTATLATSADGQPFASLIIPACAADLSVLVLLSSLSGHTRHLRVEPRCSVLACGAAESANPLTAPRITITGLAAPADDPALRARFLAWHPYASQYADFADFSLWRIRPAGGMYVGGFARAARLRAAELLPDEPAVAAVAAAEAAIMAHCNAGHAGTMAAIAGEPGEWRMAAVDVDGFDLAREDGGREDGARGDQVKRIHFRAPVADADGVRLELAAMAEQARG